MRRGTDPLGVSRVVGDVVDPFEKSIDMIISYSNREVMNGTDFRPSAVVSPPTVHIGGDSGRCFCTLVMIDPDAPTPTNPVDREYLHWMVTDIPETGEISQGSEIVPYQGPQPTYGIHRMVFVLFRQLARHMVHGHQGRRTNFNTRQFAELHSLGSPAAVVYFNCQRERGTGGRRFA